MKTVIKTLAIVVVVLILSSVVLSVIGGVELRVINPWLDEKKTTDIIKVEIVSRNYGIAPNSQVICYYSTDKEIISRVFDWYGDAKIAPVIDMTDMGLYFGGYSMETVFTFSDGSTKVVEVQNGYFAAGLLLFEMSTSTDLNVGGMNRFFRFMSNNDGYKVYSVDDSSNPVKEINNGASKLGFEIYEGTADKDNATHIIETSFGDIYVITDKICYLDIKNDSLSTGDGYYTFYETDFNEIIQ